jgi:hypothetical protein
MPQFLGRSDEIRVEVKQKEFLCPLSWSVHTPQLHEFTCSCVQAKIFRHGNKVLFPLLWYIQPLFNNVMKALNLFFNKYVAEVQLPAMAFGCSPYHRGSTQSSDIVKKCKEQRQLQLTVAWS